jgi:PhoPQ-activated pathogenicity-related protein
MKCRREESKVLDRLSMSIAALLFVLTGLFRTPADSAFAADARSRPLIEYVNKPDASYHWTKVGEGTIGKAQYVELLLTSQTWKDIVWRHQLFVIKPDNVEKPATQAILMVTGGDWHPELEKAGRKPNLPPDSQYLALVASQLREPLAVLLDVPFQPIFGGKEEDGIIAFTFDKFLVTGESDWPVLLPMLKSAVRAMDAVQAFSRKEWTLDIKKFTVTGASKRGWTTWLTGAVDGRTAGIIPMVFDTLNMRPQAKLQVRSFGAYSDQVNDYTVLHLQERMNTPPGEALRNIVDPYAYLEMLKLPKLLMMGTNDAYWPLEAANLYWNDLLGEKYLLYVPNNGHGLDDFRRVIGSVLAFQEHVAQGKPLPKLKWQFERGDSSLHLVVESNLKPKSVVAWTATAKSRDFRGSKWTSQPARLENGAYRFDLPVPAEGFAAAFGEATFANGVLPYFLSTNVRIVGKTDKEPVASKLGQ